MTNSLLFETAVRDYLAGRRDWDSVHRLAVQMENDNQADFPPEIRRPMEDLHFTFLADSNDDPQFRADRQEVSDALVELDKLKDDIASQGAATVAQREMALAQERDRLRKSKYVERRKRRQRT
jgi:hypothetical protein